MRSVWPHPAESSRCWQMSSPVRTLPSLTAGMGTWRADRPTLAWLALAACFVIVPWFNAELPWLKAYPKELVLPLAPALNQFMTWFVSIFDVAFKAISWTLEWPIMGVQIVLHWLPWPVTICI